MISLTAATAIALFTLSTVQAAPANVPGPAPSGTNGGVGGSPAALAQTDNPPNLSGADIITQCLGLANYARQHYNPGVNNLVWDTQLAQYAADSATYAATNNCWDCHTNSGAGTSWGQNLFLSKKSCQEAYYGWVTNEAAGNDPANPDKGHWKNVVGLAVPGYPYRTIGCGVSYVGQGATVCNYGL